MQVGDDYHGNLDIARIDALLARLRATVPHSIGADLAAAEPPGNSAMFEPVLLKNVYVPDGHLIATYEAGGGYRALEKALKEYTPDDIVELVKRSNLRGRGGAGFPTGMKWSFVPKRADKPKYLCCNADEGEPGTFKDRIIMERDPHQLIEGMAISAYAIGAEVAYVYVRGEYVLAIRRLEQAIAEAEAKGYLGARILGSDFNFVVHVHCGAGAYICGEETAMLDSLEGKRAQPRLKPPFPAVAGSMPARRSSTMSRPWSACRISWRAAPIGSAASGRRRAPARSFIASAACAQTGALRTADGNSASRAHRGSCRRAADRAQDQGGDPRRCFRAGDPGAGLDVGMDFDSLAAVGSMLGSAGVIVVDDTTCMVRVATRIIEFFHHESCGKCTPCREGLNWVVKVLRRIEAGEGAPGDMEQLDMLCKGIFGNTFCALGDGAAMGLRASLTHFRDEFVAHIEERRCPFV